MRNLSFRLILCEKQVPASGSSCMRQDSGCESHATCCIIKLCGSRWTLPGYVCLTDLQSESLRRIVMYAVIETGGKQYRVAPGDVVRVETLPGDVGSEVEFGRVRGGGNDWNEG